MSAKDTHHTIRHVTTVLAVVLISTRSGAVDHEPRRCSSVMISHPSEEITVGFGGVRLDASDDRRALAAPTSWLSRQDVAAMAAEYRLMRHYIRGLTDAMCLSYRECSAWWYCQNIVIEGTSSSCNGGGGTRNHRGNGGGAK